MSVLEPIESAPKDGTWVYAGTAAVCVKAFLHVPYPLRYQFRDGDWYANDGCTYDPKPTHWMPALSAKGQKE